MPLDLNLFTALDALLEPPEPGPTLASGPVGQPSPQAS